MNVEEKKAGKSEALDKRWKAGADGLKHTGLKGGGTVDTIELHAIPHLKDVTFQPFETEYSLHPATISAGLYWTLPPRIWATICSTAMP